MVRKLFINKNQNGPLIKFLISWINPTFKNKNNDIVATILLYYSYCCFCALYNIIITKIANNQATFVLTST